MALPRCQLLGNNITSFYGSSCANIMTSCVSRAGANESEPSLLPGGAEGAHDRLAAQVLQRAAHAQPA
eukprot:3872882-Pyramimonas_sp.AAC.1